MAIVKRERNGENNGWFIDNSAAGLLAVLTILTILGSIIVTATTIKNDVAANEEVIDEIKPQVRENQEQIAVINNKLDNLQTGQEEIKTLVSGQRKDQYYTEDRREQ